MKMFLSSIENGIRGRAVLNAIPQFNYNLMSFYYMKNSNRDIVQQVIKRSKLIMIDSGAHSFQKGKVVDWVGYTRRYAEWIKANDSQNILGFFEMDVDNVLRTEKVLKLRKILTNVSDKIIPVWHKERGIKDFTRMCCEYEGRIVAITGFSNEEIRDDQYILFLEEAWKHNCRVHCLGMTRKKILDRVPFDYVDSSTWVQNVVWGRTLTTNQKLANTGHIQNKEERHRIRDMQTVYNYKQGMEMQAYYENKWLMPTAKLKEKIQNEMRGIQNDK